MSKTCFTSLFSTVDLFGTGKREAIETLGAAPELVCGSSDFASESDDKEPGEYPTGRGGGPGGPGGRSGPPAKGTFKAGGGREWVGKPVDGRGPGGPGA